MSFNGHTCTRHCYVENVWGNLYTCRSSGTNHVCDRNCDQRIHYDRYSDACRVSKKIFPRDDSAGTEARLQRKRLNADGMDLDSYLQLGKRGREQAVLAERESSSPRCCVPLLNFGPGSGGHHVPHLIEGSGMDIN
eukprot:jgi/Mesvir1/14263/Mv09697-RA.1